MVEKSVREEVDEWLKKAPKCIKIQHPMSIVPQYEEIIMMGNCAPMLIEKGFAGRIDFICKSWEKVK